MLNTHLFFIMSTPLCDNEYGFSVAEHNPFFIFPYLQQLAAKHWAAGEILDLSRGDPGLGFCPSGRGRAFFSFLMAIDTVLNSNQTGFRIHRKGESAIAEIEHMIRTEAERQFAPAVAAEHLETLEEVIAKLQGLAKEEGCEISRLDVLQGIFQRSTLAGGSYHTPWGEPLVKLAIAGMYRDVLHDDTIRSHDLIFTLGVNDAIGTLFKMLGKEGFGFLQAGDTVAASTPAYSPYFNEINKRGLNIVEIPSDVPGDELTQLEQTAERIKVIFLISPNNPTGVGYDDEQVKKIAEIAEKHDALIITDEIYAQFYADFQTVWQHAKKRTLRLCGRSKIERSPGLRFGDVLITDEANEYLTAYFKEYSEAPDFRTQFMWSKAPGGTFASFQHTAAVPGPSQILGMLHVLLGADEQQGYVEMVDANMNAFFGELGLQRNNAMYYGLFDLNEVAGSNKRDVSIDKKLHDLAVKHGVVLIPAMKFFSEAAQIAVDKSQFVRVSLPNLTTEQATEAAKRIKIYLTS